MAVHTIIPNSNVLLADIRDTLNNHGSSCTNDVISFFDSRAVINQWSFFKPYSGGGDTFKLTDEQIRALRCGFSPYYFSAYTSLPSYIDGNMNGWVYNRPFGDANSPYRVGDYVGYFPKATPMIQNFYVPSRVSKGETSSVSATAIVNSSQDKKSVSLADLGDLANYYAAVYVKQSSGSQYRKYVGSQISSGAFSVDIPITDLNTGDWEVYPFIVADENTNAGYTLPNVNKSVMSIITTNFNIGVRAERATDGTQSVDYTITITNSSSAVTWTNNTWRLRFFGKDFSDSMQQYEMSGNLDSPISIPSNSTKTITGRIENINSSMWSQAAMVLWVSFNTGAYVDSGVVVQNVQGL